MDGIFLNSVGVVGGICVNHVWPQYALFFWSCKYSVVLVGFLGSCKFAWLCCCCVWNLSALRFCMSSAWNLHGFCADAVLIRYGLHVDSVWLPPRFSNSDKVCLDSVCICEDSVRLLRGFCVDSVRVSSGVNLYSTGKSYTLSMDALWVPR